MMTVEGPDRGYSWVILLCCTYIQFALFGLFRSWGVIYVAVIAEYHVNREEASWPFSLCSSVFQLTGPAVSILTHFISKRATCLLGSTIATIGVVGCYFANSVLWITVFYGVIHGLGFGIVVTLVPVLLNQYFVKHRASALGIAFTGGSVSSFLVPIVMKWLLDNYGLRGSFLLLGGLVMNTLVASALLKSAPWLSKEKTISVSLFEDSEAKDSGVSIGEIGLATEMKDTAAFDYQVQDDLQDTVSADSQGNGENNNSSFVDTSQLEHSNLEDAADKLNSIVSNNDRIPFDGSFVKIEKSCNSDKRKKDKEVTNDCKVIESLMNGEEHIKPKNCNLENKKSKFQCSAHYPIAEILKSHYFYLIALSFLVFYVSLQSFFVVIVDYAKDKGVERNEGAYLMSIFSLTDILGRSLLGWITDRKYVKRQNMVIFNFIASSIVMQLYPLFNSFIGLLIVAAFHGVAAGSCITLFFVLQAEYFGVEKLTLVVGLSNFINGALTLLGPVIIGVFRDTIGSYDWMFRSFGLVSLLFSFLWIAESWLTRPKICANNTI